MSKLYLLYGLIVVGAMATAQYEGWRLTPVSEAEFEGLMMFLNHSCEPNVGIQGQIVFVALRGVAAGEELTLDYATIERPAHDSSVNGSANEINASFPTRRRWVSVTAYPNCGNSPRAA